MGAELAVVTLAAYGDEYVILAMLFVLGGALLVQLLCAVSAAGYMEQKQRSREVGFLPGLFLGLLGVFIAWALDDADEAANGSGGTDGEATD